MIQNSILQGSLVIDAEEFEKRFPSENGYRMLLVDSSVEKVEMVKTKLSEGLMDFGIELTTAQQRLVRFNAVENTYLSIFQLLGGLAVILGTTGLGLVVLLNIIDRRGELGMMRAIGFGKDTLKRMIIYEHLGLIVTGLLFGVAAALVAVTPAIRTPRSELPYLSVGITIACILINSVVWIWLASWSALRANLLDALRNE